jgi:hypothetical protein
MLTPRVGNDYPDPSRFTKDDMKETKRLSIEYPHREVTITVAGATLHVENSGLDAADVPAMCPTCGSAWIAVVASVDRDLPGCLDHIRGLLQQYSLQLRIWMDTRPPFQS